MTCEVRRQRPKTRKRRLISDCIAITAQFERIMQLNSRRQLRMSKQRVDLFVQVPPDKKRRTSSFKAKSQLLFPTDSSDFLETSTKFWRTLVRITSTFTLSDVTTHVVPELPRIGLPSALWVLVQKCWGQCHCSPPVLLLVVHCVHPLVDGDCRPSFLRLFPEL